MKILTNEEYKDIQKTEHTLINVLPKEHFEQFALDNAINICVYETSFNDKVQALHLDRNHLIVVYGESENELDAKAAAFKLDDLGFKNILILQAQLSETDTDQLLCLDNGKYHLRKGSNLEWTGANANGSHFGDLLFKEGYIEVENMQLSGEFIVDMNSINTLDLKEEEGSLQLNEHLKSDDFFLSKIFPEAKYSFSNLKPLDSAYQTDINYILDGDLSIKNISRRQQVQALITKNEKCVVVNIRVEINRTHWDVLYGSSKYFKFLGMHKIFDLISLEMRLEFVK